MSEEGNKKLFDHYTAVASGSVKSGNSVSNELIVSDAKKHLADLIKKNPSLVVGGVVEKPANPEKFESHKPEKEAKSKEKK